MPRNPRIPSYRLLKPSGRAVVTIMAVESLSRLETGAQTNPTWRTLASFAAAVGCRPRLTAETGASHDS